MKSNPTRLKVSGATTAKTRLSHTRRTLDLLVNYEKWGRTNTSGLVYSASYAPLCRCKRGASMSIRRHSQRHGGGWSLRLNCCNCSSTKRSASLAMSVVHEILDCFFMTSLG